MNGPQTIQLLKVVRVLHQAVTYGGNTIQQRGNHTVGSRTAHCLTFENNIPLVLNRH